MARIIEGDEPWSSALLQALRTWRFRPPPEDAILSFRVEAQFVPGPGRDAGRVKLQLSGLRETALLDAPEEEPTPVAALEPTGVAEDRAGEREESAGEPEGLAQEPQEPVAGPEEPAGGPEPSSEQTEAAAGRIEPEPTAAEEPEAPPPPETETEEAAPEAPEAPGRTAQAMPESSDATQPGSEAAPAPPVAPGGAAAAARGAAPPATAPAAGPAVAASGPSPIPEGVPTADATAPPPIEVLRAMPPPPPPENGISAIRGVLLEPGVPDLTRGRRPVSPPFARMAGVSGVVEVDFSVSAGGITAVQKVDGPELLRPAATQAVESWTFRRTRADRAYLTAVFTYEDDLASAVVKPQPAP